MTYPCIHAIWANWAPPLERSKLATLAFSGSFVGTVFAMPVSGLMAQYWGWASIFYVFGVLGLIWFVSWWLIVTDKPEDDPYISKDELKYIKDSLGYVDDKKVNGKLVLGNLFVLGIVIYAYQSALELQFTSNKTAYSYVSHD